MYHTDEYDTSSFNGKEWSGMYEGTNTGREPAVGSKLQERKNRRWWRRKRRRGTRTTRAPR